MHPELFHLPGGATIYSYGVMMVVGFLAAIELAKFLARRTGLNPDHFVTAAIIAMVAGVVGARVSHVLENLHEYTRSDRSIGQNLWNMINLRTGGLTFYGGFILAFASCVLYAVWRKIPLRRGMDIVAPCVLIGLGFGRIGCFLNGCCYGATCDVNWASVEFPYHSPAYIDQVREGKIVVPSDLIAQDADGRSDLLDAKAVEASPRLKQIANETHSEPLIPAQLYSTVTAWLLAAFLLAYFTMPHAPGRVFALMLMLEGLSRFLLEILRAEPAVVKLGAIEFSLSMLLGVGLSLLGVVLWFVFKADAQDDSSDVALAAPAHA